MVELITCKICEKKRKDEIYSACPYCGWGFSDFEDLVSEDEKEPYNLISIKEAKALLARGLNIWGEPLPKNKCHGYERNSNTYH